MKSTPFAIMVAAALARALSASAAPPTPAVDYARVPLSFEPNRGQTSAEVRFLSRGPDTRVPTERARCSLCPAGQPPRRRQAEPVNRAGVLACVSRVQPRAARWRLKAAARSTTGGRIPERWQVNVPNYGKSRTAISIRVDGRATSGTRIRIRGGRRRPHVIRLPRGRETIRGRESGDLSSTGGGQITQRLAIDSRPRQRRARGARGG